MRNQLSKETANQTIRADSIQAVFNKLTDWFDTDSDNGKGFFQDIYDNRYLLTTRKETIRRLGVATIFEETMNDNNLELKQAIAVLENSAEIIKLIASGDVLLPSRLNELFQHISLHSPYAKVKIDDMIERSIRYVYEELDGNSNYSVDSTLEEWIENNYSDTVFSATRIINGGNSIPIRIVIRPSDDAKIIFYEEIEVTALDDADCELWTCDENNKVRMITLGELLIITGISTIPLKNIMT